jgi:Zn-dependent membrane protease YugP
MLIVLALLFGLAMLPQMWVRKVVSAHAGDRPDFPGTGGEFARHILDEMKLNHVTVEESKVGDHYDPEAKVIRLQPENFKGRSLSAVVIAAHEAGHAMQDATGYPPLAARTRLAKQALKMERAGAIVMLAAPIVMALTKTPHLLIFEVFIGVMMLGLSVVMHAVTLPVLKAGGYIPREDMRGARKILTAAAFTYVAAAAMSLLDIARWVRVLRI